MTLVDLKMYKWKPSLISASAIYTAKKVLNRNTAWSAFMGEQSSFDEKTVRDCAKDICAILNYADERKDYEAVYKKFSLAKFNEVAKLC